MKRTAAALLCLCLLLLSGCGPLSPIVSTTDTSIGLTDTTLPSTTLPNTTLPNTTLPNTTLQTNPGQNSDTSTTSDITAKPITAGSIPRNTKASYGEDTGTDSTYTGYEPLPLRVFSPTDPENTRKLSNTVKNHSFGVAKNGEPNSISVNNQEYYSQFGAFTLDTSGKMTLYLTFDCGYENGYTEQILNVLLEKNVPAAFFVTLPYLKSSPEIAARMIKEGHTVGNHSATHPNFSTISRTQMATEIQRVDDYLRQHFGYSAPYFRFPEGACSENSLELVCSLGFTSVFWSTAYSDWDTQNQKGADYAYNTVTARLHHGCVLLLHVASKDNAAALGRIIDYALENGYEFVTLG